MIGVLPICHEAQAPAHPPRTLGNMRRLGVQLAALCMIGFLATIARAAPAVVHECGRLDSIANLVEPVKGFANDTIRIAHISTEEPAAAPDHLLIFVSVEPMGDECFAVSAGRNLGFYSLDVAKTQASYDAQKRLLLVVPVSVSDPDKGVGKPAGDVRVRVNRKNGNSVTIELNNVIGGTTAVTKQKRPPGPPMTLGNMRHLGVQRLVAS